MGEEAEPAPRAVGSAERAKHLFSKRCSSVVACVNDPRRTPFSNETGSAAIVADLGN